ncbi:MAG: sigma-70 family RNA polymerase sigma factor [Bacteroidetes bacterium]|nr:sigma-70 family RNA polymerase sigma factor [Bacteroidota bacterium]
MNNYSEMSDEKLIQFYLSGNPAALATLVELYKDRIYTSIFTMVQDKFIAEEIFRDVFITIINDMMIGKTADNGDFLQWAIQVAHRLCIEHTRKTKMAIVLDEKVEKENTDTAVDFGIPVIANNTPFYESHGKIKSMIAMLPDEQREVLALNHYAGLSFKEIAGIMKCSLTGALDTMKIGLHNLRKLMNEKEIVLR